VRYLTRYEPARTGYHNPTLYYPLEARRVNAHLPGTGTIAQSDECRGYFNATNMLSRVLC
jgi:hypothetical protein